MMLGAQVDPYDRNNNVLSVILICFLQIVSTFPTEWFKDLEGDSTIRQLEPFCRYLVHAATTLSRHVLTSSDLEKRRAK